MRYLAAAVLALFGLFAGGCGLVFSFESLGTILKGYGDRDEVLILVVGLIPIGLVIAIGLPWLLRPERDRAMHKLIGVVLAVFVLFAGGCGFQPVWRSVKRFVGGEWSAMDLYYFAGGAFPAVVFGGLLVVWWMKRRGTPGAL